MSTKPNDGGPAYPTTHYQYSAPREFSPETWEGMTIRDYFAGQALASLILRAGSGEADIEMERLGLIHGETDKLCAKCAYDYADAMLAEREKGQSDE